MLVAITILFLYFCVLHTRICTEQTYVSPYQDNYQDYIDHRVVSFLNEEIPLKIWYKLQDQIISWSEQGQWLYDDKMIVVDNITKYAPCPMPYGIKNPCSWVLDGNSMKYYFSSSLYKDDNVLIPFRATAMCDLLKPLNGNILLVGDSMSRDCTNSWRNFFFMDLGVACPIDKKSIPYCNGLRIEYIRNDYLTLTIVDVDEYQLSWITRLEELNISMIILNRGAHFKEDDETIADINNTMHYLRKHHPLINVIFRSTPHGHTDYQQHFYTPPLIDIPYLNHDHQYHYGLFKRQNSKIQRLV